MDCDQVFMILTRGPFPTGEVWDEQVEAHLESCSDCWRLAEALRPALEVFQEAVPPAESRELPGYWGDARPSSVMLGQMTQAATRTVLATDVRRVQQHCRNYPPRAAGQRVLDRRPARSRFRRHGCGGRSNDCLVFPRRIVAVERSVRRLFAHSGFMG